VSIFMSVFNVHVNRAPVAGRVEAVVYRPGKFLNASLDKASADNERNAVTIESESGARIVVVQIAGLIARRIICHVAPEQGVTRGQRFGMICFGSRLEVYLPPDAQLACAVGDKVLAGTSIVGRLV
jgi:phosphatidylserine decarboxylase